MTQGRRSYSGPPDWRQLFAYGLTDAVSAAMDVAGGARLSLSDRSAPLPVWERARRWFLSAYPLLGATMSALTLVADAEIARGWDIPIAAVDPVAGELYVNPLAVLTEREWRFVLAHESLHAALAHHTRTGGRDPYLFNLATDFVINGWLLEMGVGRCPLASSTTRGSPGSRARRCTTGSRPTRAGTASCPPCAGARSPTSSTPAVGCRAPAHPSTSTRSSGGRSGRGSTSTWARGAATCRPRWCRRSARWRRLRSAGTSSSRGGSRRCSRAGPRAHVRPSLPEAGRDARHPRPGWLTPEVPTVRRTFGVVLDTSGSMDARLLGKALGAIASYARAHDVPAARVVFCDAAAYDAGYLDVDDIAGRVRVRGRGGTVLQPGVHALEHAADFPRTARS
ncbi:hypothetical protein BC477_00665 [Clavibacter michiganensis subsp. michiganensis]|uniref:Putative metallopeptidase domain-containing protein n=1 Tax=Clavibacter michiganensis subsp. michiganensis TaxID=33013 RepID=A0A251XF42_CLAMM|nr:hypothetical protein BC477_00665 [Clavibacter michiganensis subsp. michiganensis]OUE00912.1 hypothetical protein CMMCAS07_15850 [Clavibacter michiganensis subsp. michiganensis]